MQKNRTDMRIIFFGTPDFAVASLNALVEQGREVCMVVTTPDKPVGRHQNTLVPSAVKQYALEHGLPLMQPDDLTDCNFLSTLKQMQADLGIVVAFRKLPREVWTMPRLGTFNLHGSLLPRYRGAAPINWAIINGETETGVTTFMLDDRIDTGSLLLSHKLAIGKDDTFGEVYLRLMQMGAGLTLETVEGIEQGKLTPVPQTGEVLEHQKRAPKLFRENTRIDWHKSPTEIHNLVRGLSPAPAAWTLLEGEGLRPQQLKVFQTRVRLAEHQLPVGMLVAETRDALSVAVEGGFVDILELQVAGKKRMAAADLLRGNQSILELKVK